jgi:hypothetical protein
VTISEFTDEEGRTVHTAASARFQRRVHEVATDDEGLFVVNGLEQREYEWLAVHPRLGRALVVAPPIAPMTLEVSAERTIVGRVTTRGVPLAAVPVLILPLLDGLAQSTDLLEKIGQESRSDASGRFALAVPSRAGGDVRIGSNITGIVRRSFGPGSARAIIDLGDIDLGAPVVARVWVDGSDRCEVSAVGPLGRVGMQVIVADPEGAGVWRLEPPERGTWSLVVTCGGAVASTEPSALELHSSTETLTVRIMSIER